MGWRAHQTVVELLFAFLLLVLLSPNTDQVVEGHSEFLAPFWVHFQLDVDLEFLFDFLDLLPKMVHHRRIVDLICLLNNCYCL